MPRRRGLHWRRGIRTGGLPPPQSSPEPRGRMWTRCGSARSRCRALLSSLATNGRGCMCLAVPMRVDEISGFLARCSAKGVERDVSLFLIQDEPVEVGDHVLVHVGYAIQKVSAEDA